jgi:hypothetical protein
MKRILLTAACGLLLAAVGCNSICGESCKNADSIVTEMEKAVNVSNKSTLPSSAIIIYDSGIGDKNKSQVTLKLKAHNKIRLEIKRKDSIMVSAFNGKKGWEYITGKKLRVLQGNELAELKYQAAYLAPNVKLKKLFSTIKLAGSAEAAGIKCWKLICTPRACFESQPVELFVDKEKFLVVKSIEKIDKEKKIIEITTYFGDYEDKDGIMVPQLMISQINGTQLLESKLVSVKWDAYLADSEFDMPKALTSAK